jgi:hypothetical protein
MEPEDQINEVHLLKYTFLITPYAAGVSLLYLLGYWGSFRINIFNFISLSDILKLALLPVLYLILCSAVTGTSMYFMTAWKDKQNEKKKMPPQPISPRFSFILNCSLALISIAILVFMSGPDKWIWFGAINGVIFARVIETLKVSKRIITNDNLRLSIAVLVAVPLLSAFGVGKRNARSVLISDDKSRLIDTKLLREYGSQSFNDKHLLQGQEKLKFVGCAGDYVFLLSVDNSKTYVIKFSDLHYLEFNN